MPLTDETEIVRVYRRTARDFVDGCIELPTLSDVLAFLRDPRGLLPEGEFDRLRPAIAEAVSEVLDEERTARAATAANSRR